LTGLVGRYTNPCMKVVPPTDKRETLINAGLAVLREHGYTGFTQPRVAAQAGLRQSHLTYYYPSRQSLLAAVARAAIDRQFAALDALIPQKPVSARAAAARIANLIVRKENTRVLLALVQAADQDAELRELFRELAAGMVVRGGRILGGKKGVDGAIGADLGARVLHALSIGIAVLTLAADPPDAERRAALTLEMALKTLA
jgi:AcrR family transcriptional regulator